MPLDGMTPSQPSLDLIAAQAALGLDMVESFFRCGAMWTDRAYRTPDGERCVADAAWFVRLQIGNPADRAVECPWPRINDNLQGVRR
jgi:hypothetical protein